MSDSETQHFDFDVAVIGSGPGGYRAAVYAALRGLSVCIVERATWGGCCLNRGCVPKKDWYHSARMIAAQKSFADRGIRGDLHGDMDRAWGHQKNVVETIRDSYSNYLKHLKVRAIEGSARFIDRHTLAIEREGSQETVRARYSVIATGANAQVPAPFFEAEDRILTTDTLFDRPAPAGDRVAIIGSGVVATEFAFIFTMLGKKVTWLTRSAPLSSERFTPQARNVLNEACQRHAIEAIRVDRYDAVDVSNQVSITCGDAVHHVDWVVLGTGRRPCVDGLGLDALGVETDHNGRLARRATLQLTDVENVYAIGDVASRWMTANHALSDATLAIDNILDALDGQPPQRYQDGRYVPVAIYAAIEMARFGLDEDQAEDDDLEPATGFAAFETNPRALGQDEAEGFVRLLADMDSGDLLGGEIIGAEAGELIHLLTLAPNRETALSWLASGTWNHPARAEELLNATETLAKKWNLQDHVFKKASTT